MKQLRILIVALILAACSGQNHGKLILEAVEKMVEEYPDSALTILDSLESSSQSFSHSNLRKWQLLRLTAQNKCDTIFRSDSLQHVLTDYHDLHGTPNERMIAHYLLGRAKSDMGEAPEAMRCLQEAADCADTTSLQCDWRTLSRIYLQLADEYYSSYMPTEMKEALRLSQICSIHAADSITSIIAYAKLSEVYELMGSQDSAAIVIREAAHSFQNHGRHDLASQLLSLLIEDEVERGNIEEASSIVRYYEGHSGYFNMSHEIEYGREIYYYSKGIYYLGAGRPDSAEWMFRKLLCMAQDMNDTHAAYLGLRKKYDATGPKDSLSKYAILSESANDSLYQENYRYNIHLFQKRFNYSRHVEKEQQLKLSNEKKSKLILVITFSFIIISAAVVTFFLYRRKKKETQLKEYREDLERLRQLKTEMAGLMKNKEATIIHLSRESMMQQSDIDNLKEHIHDLTEKLKESRRLTSEAISAKDEEIRLLTEKYKNCDKYLVNKTRDDMVKTIRKSDIIRELEFITLHPVHAPSTEDWDRLDSLFHEVHPNFPATLQDKFKLNANEYRLCQLVFAGFPPKSIAVLMGFNKSNVSNIRKRLLTKLTGKDGKASEFDQFLSTIPLF